VKHIVVLTEDECDIDDDDYDNNDGNIHNNDFSWNTTKSIQFTIVQNE
jgi:hypothetical protein